MWGNAPEGIRGPNFPKTCTIFHLDPKGKKESVGNQKKVSPRKKDSIQHCFEIEK